MDAHFPASAVISNSWISPAYSTLEELVGKLNLALADNVIVITT